MSDHPDDLFTDVEQTTAPPPPLAVRDVVLDPTFGKRRDSLLRTIPIHDLADRAARTDSGLTGFDVRALALAAFDAVIARQGFPDRATPDQVSSLLAGIAAVQNPAAAAGTCVAAAEHVIDGLTNRRQRERQFTYQSAVYREGERFSIASTSVARPFWLLREQEDQQTGETYLEASADAINALVGALDMRIEDQQAALEIVLERQLARGELDAAQATAVAARSMTAAYIIETDELLAETERYLPGTDWKVAGPGLVAAALAHISECLDREGRLLEHVAGGRDERAGEDGAERRAKISLSLTKLLEESRHLHTALMERLIGARGRFLDAQNQQMFRPVLTSIELDLTEDLLVPMLGLRNRDAAQLTEEYLREALGPRPPALLHWGDFVGVLFPPPAEDQEQDQPAGDDEDLIFRPDPAPLVSRELLEATQKIISSVAFPTRLSSLLAACPDPDGSEATPCDLICAAALRSYDNAERDHMAAGTPRSPAPPPAGEGPGVAEADFAEVQPVHLLEVFGPDVAAYADGTLLDGVGWSGDDLIVCADRDQLDGVLLGDAATPEPAALPDRHLRGTL